MIAPTRIAEVTLHRHLRASVFFVVFIVFFSTRVSMQIDHSMGADWSLPLFITRWAVIVFTMVLLLATLLLRDRLSRRMMTAGLMLVQIPILINLCAAQKMYMLSAFKQPPDGFKMALVVFALVEVGHVAWNAISLSVFAVAASVCWRVYIWPQNHEIAIAELWALGAFFFVGLATLFVRIEYERVRRRLHQAEVDARSAQYLAKVFLNVRDRANTPLQSLELGLEILRGSKECPGAVVDSMQASLERLKELSQTFARFEGDVDWSDESLLTSVDGTVGARGSDD
jgi:hypothetical protein